MILLIISFPQRGCEATRWAGLPLHRVQQYAMAGLRIRAELFEQLLVHLRVVIVLTRRIGRKGARVQRDALEVGRRVAQRDRELLGPS